MANPAMSSSDLNMTFPEMAQQFCDTVVGLNEVEIKSGLHCLCKRSLEHNSASAPASSLTNNVGGESQRVPECLLSSEYFVVAQKHLRTAGFFICGQGDDAVTFAHEDHDWVVRLGQNQKPFSDFVAFVQNENSSAFPRFDGHAVADGFCVSIVEILHHIPLANKSLWRVSNNAANLAYTIADGRPLVDQEDLLGADLARAAMALGKEARRLYYALDLSAENIMYRSTANEIVFNDPWSPWGEG